MPVRLFMSSGFERVIESADGAYVDGPFFIVTRTHRPSGESDTVLTLLAGDVVSADVVVDGVTTQSVAGNGRAPMEL